MKLHRDEYIALSSSELLEHCEFSVSRGSGPGGQKRNKTESAVQLGIPEMNVLVRSDASRSQHQNKKKALRMLREKIATSVRLPWEPAHALELQKALRLKDIGRSTDATYWVTIARGLDLFVFAEGGLATAAKELNANTAQMAKLFGSSEEARRAANEIRSQFGLKAMK